MMGKSGAVATLTHWAACFELESSRTPSELAKLDYLYPYGHQVCDSAGYTCVDLVCDKWFPVVRWTYNHAPGFILATVLFATCVIVLVAIYCGARWARLGKENAEADTPLSSLLLRCKGQLRA